MRIFLEEGAFHGDFRRILASGLGRSWTGTSTEKGSLYLAKTL